MKKKLLKGDGFDGQRKLVIPPLIEGKCGQMDLIKSLFVCGMGCFPKAKYHYLQRPTGISQAILIYCTQGKGWVQVRKQRSDVRAGDLAVIPPDEYHSYAADDETPWSIYWFHLKGELIRQLPALLGGNTHQKVLPIGVSEDRIALFDSIYETFSNGYSQSNLLFANLSLQYFLASCLLPERYLKQPPATDEPDPVAIAIAYMREHVSVPLKLAKLAQACHLSVSYFSSVFKKRTGYSPMDYFNQLRIQHACQFLSFSSLRINEIASRIGIDDPFYFSRLFKQQMGTSPLEYRRTGEERKSNEVGSCP